MPVYKLPKSRKPTKPTRSSQLNLMNFENTIFSPLQSLFINLCHMMLSRPSRITHMIITTLLNNDHLPPHGTPDMNSQSFPDSAQSKKHPIYKYPKLKFYRCGNPVPINQMVFFGQFVPSQRRSLISLSNLLLIEGWVLEHRHIT